MPIIEVSSSGVLRECPAELWAFGLESPAAGNSSDIYALQLRGWVIPKTSPIVAIEVVHEGEPIGRAIIEHERPDILPQAPNVKIGFDALIGMLGVKPAFELQLDVLLADQKRIRIGVVQGKQQGIRSNYEPKLQPLTVSCIGRSGTTWLMRLLSEHPSIVSHHLYPHEVRAGTYWAHLLRIATAPANHTQSGHLWTFHENLHWAGYLPDYWAPAMKGYPELLDWLGRTHVEEMAGLCQRSIDMFYELTAKAQGQVEPTYFVEKHYPIVGSLTGQTGGEHVSGIVARLFRALYSGSREILLMRDFRDRLCSIKSFNAQNQAVQFGRQHVTSDEEFVWRLRREAQLFLQYRNENADNVHFMRYEDLILRPEETLKAAFEYLGVDADSKTISSTLERAQQDTPELRRHRTAGSDPKASVERWRRDMDPALMPICQQALSDVMQEFGYAA